MNLPALVPTREREFGELLAAAAPGERSRLVLVTAPPGGGLTTVLRSFAEQYDGPVHRLVGLPWERDQPGATLAGLPDGWATPARRGDGTTGWDVVVVVEDAHHADAESVQRLVSTAHRRPDLRLLLVLGWQAPAGAPYDAVVAAADVVLPLAPVQAADVVALAEQRGVLLPTTQVDRLLRHAGGRVANVIDILTEVAPADWTSPHFSLPAPATAARAIRTALDGLPVDARRLVVAIAVLENADRQATELSVVQAAEVADVAVDAAAVDACLASGLLTAIDESATWVRLVDPIARRVVLDAAGLTERSRLHAVAARVVDEPAIAVRHAWFTDPRPDPDLADRLETIAETEAQRGSWATAADLLVLASRATDDHELRGARLVRAIDALIGAGDVPRASRFLAEVESLRETPYRNAVLGYLAVVRGRPSEAEHKLTRAWDLVNPRRDPGTASVIAQRRVLHSLARCRPGELVAWADEALALAGPDEPAAVESAAIRGLGVAAAGGAVEALADYQQLLERVPQGPVAQRVVMASGWLHLALDQPEQAREELESAVPIDFLGGSRRISLWARGWLARVQFLTGDWDGAMTTASAGVDLAHRSGMALVVPLLEWTRVQVHALRGDWAEAEDCLRDGDAGARDYEIMRVPAALARAALEEARTDYNGVIRALAPLLQPWAREWVNAPGFWPWTDVYANALVVLGRTDEADAFLTPHEARAVDAGHISTRARLAYARGRWAGQRGDLDAARRSFEGALDLLAPLSLRYDRARVQFAFGQTLRRAGRRAEADAVLTAARDAYLALGAHTYVRRCERELAAGGVNVVRGQREFDDLTPQEEAVAGLVAQGRSNKEVAAELFLSVKTVQYHLTRIYAKVGVRSRAELAARRAH